MASIANYGQAILESGSALFGIALIRLGASMISSPVSASKDFGIDVTEDDARKLMPVVGVRDAGFGAAILCVLASSKSGLLSLRDGTLATAIVTIVGACVGLADGLCVYAAGGRGWKSHAGGASIFAGIGTGLVYMALKKSGLA